jgi:hypothetical protein
MIANPYIFVIHLSVMAFEWFCRRWPCLSKKWMTLRWGSSALELLPLQKMIGKNANLRAVQAVKGRHGNWGITLRQLQEPLVCCPDSSGVFEIANKRVAPPVRRKAGQGWALRAAVAIFTVTGSTAPLLIDFFRGKNKLGRRLLLLRSAAAGRETGPHHHCQHQAHSLPFSIVLHHEDQHQHSKPECKTSVLAFAYQARPKLCTPKTFIGDRWRTRNPALFARCGRQSRRFLHQSRRALSYHP